MLGGELVFLSLTFGDAGSDRYGSPPHLLAEAVSFVVGKQSRQLVDAKRESSGSPNTRRFVGLCLPRRDDSTRPIRHPGNSIRTE
jgi:hypothetical protein